MDEYDYLFDENKNDMNSFEKIEGKTFKAKTKHEEKLIKRFDELDKIFPNKINVGETLHLISNDNFGSIELLNVIRKRYKIDYFCLSTWSYNQDFVQIIEEMLKEGVEILFIVDKSIKTRKSHLYAQIVTLLHDFDNMTLKIHHMIHTKVTLLQGGSDFLSIESSANFSNNQRIENFTITNDKQLFNFHKNWMNEIIEKTVNR